MQVSVAMVGDGSVMEVAADGAVNVILGPRATRRSQELRDYLPKFRSVVVTAKHEVPVGAVLLLVTDGLAEDIRQSATVREWVVNQLRAATNTVTAAHVLSYARQRSADDLTFVAIRPTLNG
jgi:serine/threonine protein phosphatase PrpC